MKNNMLLIVLALMAMSVKGQTIITGPNVSGIWTPAGSPYLVQASIMIPGDSTLMIQPGVRIEFKGHYKFVVLGRLLALGTNADPVRFTATDISTGWYGLRFDNSNTANDSSIIDHCILEYGRKTDPDYRGGAIAFKNFSKARVSHCLIRHNYSCAYGGGISCYDSDPVIINNTFDSNTADFVAAMNTGGGAISCDNSNSLIAGNTFINNTASAGIGGGGAIFIEDGSPVISGNLIINNTNTNNAYYGDGGGGGIFAYGHATIIGNTISNNKADGYLANGGGIYFYVNDHSTVINNTITNNSVLGATGKGGALFCDLSSYPTLINNTITNNDAKNMGGALYCYGVANLTFRNCIIYGNTANQQANQVYLYDEDSDPDFYYCDLQGGVAGFDLNGNFYTGNYENNIDTDPLFVWPTAGSGTYWNGAVVDWTEDVASPCINAGDPNGSYPETDKGGSPRVADGCIDMGAYEYPWAVGISSTPLQQTSMASPNPFSNFTTIQFSTKIESGTLKIYDTSGRILRAIDNISGDRFVIERGDLPPGLYYYQLQIADQHVMTGNIVIAVP